jgi:dTDP-4-dehydrorhamnose 3,5-epimerase
MDDSLGIDWGLAMEEALLSEKDTKHKKLAEFDTPFIYQENC